MAPSAVEDGRVPPGYVLKTGLFGTGCDGPRSRGARGRIDVWPLRSYYLDLYDKLHDGEDLGIDVTKVRGPGAPARGARG